MASLPTTCPEATDASKLTTGLGIQAEILAKDAPKLSLTLKIEDFSLLTSSQKLVKSMGFPYGGYRWRLYIYPEGPPKERVCFALEFDGRSDHSPLPCGFKVDAKFNVYIFNHLNNNFVNISGNQGSAVRFVARKSFTWSHPGLPMALLTNPAIGYLFCDQCTFGIEVLLCDDVCRRDVLSRMNGEVTGSFTFELKPFSQKFLELQNLPNRDAGVSPHFVFGDYKCLIMYSLYDRNGKLGDGPLMQSTSPDFNKNSAETDWFLSLRINLMPLQFDYDEYKCKKLEAKVLLRVKDQSLSGDHVQVEDHRWFGARSLCWPRFMEVATITNPNKGFLVNDTLIIEAEVSIQSSLDRTYISQ
ncbi:Traf-like family protein [Thalictrum thalictroides]|uniref:Traf-like family protein n=1 Tax=Thalictrum thalictroides TaxID=46969 RepID=A0A7J6X5B8_THATH|nr:Traf-like family protein [Thalictrum thalictroides]